MKIGDSAMFPNITSLASVLLTLPISNATVERLFSQMGCVKTKLRNSLAMPMVEAILMIRYSLKRRNETCADFAILPGMLEIFNCKMYDHHRAKAANEPTARNQPRKDVPRRDMEEEEDEGDEDLRELLGDVEELFGQQIFITY